MSKDYSVFGLQDKAVNSIAPALTETPGRSEVFARPGSRKLRRSCSQEAGIYIIGSYADPLDAAGCRCYVTISWSILRPALAGRTKENSRVEL